MDGKPHLEMYSYFEVVAWAPDSRRLLVRHYQGKADSCGGGVTSMEASVDGSSQDVGQLFVAALPADARRTLESDENDYVHVDGYDRDGRVLVTAPALRDRNGKEFRWALDLQRKRVTAVGHELSDLHVAPARTTPDESAFTGHDLAQLRALLRNRLQPSK